MEDVHPLPLTDEDFFSDMGGDEPYVHNPMVGTGSRLVIDVGNSESGQIISRTNPFGGTEVRARNSGNNHQREHHSGATNNTAQMQNRSVSEMNIQGTLDRDNQSLSPSQSPDNHYGAADSNHHNNNSNANMATEHHHTTTHTNTSLSQGLSSHCHTPHEHEQDNTVRNQLIAISIFTTAFGIGETVGAVFSKSIAIGTDVMHLGSDLLSFIISLIAVHLAKKHPSARFPWGFHRTEVLGALLSVFIIWVVTGVLVYLAAERVIQGTYAQLDPDKMLYTSIAGVAFNVIMALVLNVDIFKCQVSHGHSHGGGGHGHSHGGGDHGHSHGQLPLSHRRNGEYEPLSTNAEDADDIDGPNEHSSGSEGSGGREKNIVIRAAFVHVLGDLIQSIGVFVAALIIKFKGEDPTSPYRLADPICTFTFSVLVLVTTLTVVRDAFFILMEGAPSKIRYDEIYEVLMELEGVKAVHSLKIWSLTSNEVNASVHLAVDADHPYPLDLVSKANKILRQGDIVSRCAVQIEIYDEHKSRTCNQCLHPGPSKVSLLI